MWQRFTERARKIVFYAQEEAQRFGEGYVSTEHLLLGLTREPGCCAAVLLTRLGVSLEHVRSEVERQLPRGHNRPIQDMTLTPRAKRVIDLAYDEARGLNHNYIGSEHLLLGLVREGDGLAGRILAKLGVDLQALRVLRAKLDPGPEPEGSEPDADPPMRRARPHRPSFGQAFAPERLLLLIIGEAPQELLDALRDVKVSPLMVSDSLINFFPQPPMNRDGPTLDAILAKAEALRKNHSHAQSTTTHLVAAILELGDSFASETLARMGLTSDDLLSRIRQ